MMTDQFRLLLRTGLFQEASKLYIGAVSHPNKRPPWGEEWLNKFWSFSSSKEKDKVVDKVEIVFYPRNNEITDTMKWVRDYSANNPGDYILFFHTKGLTHYNRPTEDWRKYMEYFSIERWGDCIAKLDEGYDCCGVMWNIDTPIGIWPHYSGAFWWANTSYINTLNHGYLDDQWKYMREFWIGSNPNVRQFEFHNSRLNDKESLIANKGHYDVPYPRCNYEIK
jgi:hypothetical protein